MVNCISILSSKSRHLIYLEYKNKFYVIFACNRASDKIAYPRLTFIYKKYFPYFQYSSLFQFFSNAKHEYNRIHKCLSKKFTAHLQEI